MAKLHLWLTLKYMAKAKKKRAEHYDPPLAIKGTFGDVIKVSMTNPDKPKAKPAPKKQAKKK